MSQLALPSFTPSELRVYECAHRAFMRALVLDRLARIGPATADELRASLDLPANGVAPRLTELLQAGAIRRTGERREAEASRERRRLDGDAPVCTAAVLEVGL